MRACLVLALVTACGSKHTPPQPPPSPAPPDAGSAIDAAATGCTDPSPGPDYKCVQDCGPPVVRQGDPPPGWHWLSPEQQANREKFGCPRCLPADTRIATPSGDRSISELAVGSPIFTIDDSGQRVVAHVLYIGSTRVTGGHRLVRITLADGRVVSGSAGHPTAEGRSLGALALGDQLDGSRITNVEIVPLAGDQTWDVLPSGPTGLYVADGVVLRSTLFRR